MVHVKIVKHVSDKNVKDNGIVTNEYVLYDGLKKSPKALEELHMNTFFHKEKTRLWNKIKTIEYNPEQIIQMGQSPRISLLLHGPPGTGKSSFAHRIAMSLNRHLISIDGKTIKTKAAMYNLMRSPTVNGIVCRPKDVVFTFDEIHLFLRYLKQKSEKYDYKSYSSYDSYSPARDMSKKKSSTPTSSDSSEVPQLLSLDNNEVPKLFSLEKLNKETDKEVDKEVNNEFNIDSEDITINDLLEIFQGPVPLDGSIILATTNYFGEIEKLCPALVRHGRLTPCYFGCLTNDILCEMTKYFFGDTIDIDVDVNSANIPPSHAVDIMADIKLNHAKIDKIAQLELCKHQISELVNTYKK